MNGALERVERELALDPCDEAAERAAAGVAPRVLAYGHEAYRIEADTDEQTCPHCGEGTTFCVVSGTGDDEFQHTSSTTDREAAEALCDAMNDAYRRGYLAAGGTLEPPPGFDLDDIPF